uniref:Uncharacterized protein n=1 Tax=Sciurus vulgaris TaxID=55149 RepID=A0A8D2B126_SCIVU
MKFLLGLVLKLKLLIEKFIRKGRSGLGSSESQCIALGGHCRRPVCKLIEEHIGNCLRKTKCCRKWWILIPVPTPLFYSEYQEPIKPRVK